MPYKDPERKRAWMRAYEKMHDRVKRGKRSPEGLLFHSAKQRAKKRNLPFNLELADITIPAVCPVLGIPLKHGNKGFCDNSPTIDRFIPDIGYIKGNIAVISFRANRIKNDSTLEEIELLASFLKSHHQK